MADAMVLRCGPEAGRCAAVGKKARKGKWRVWGYLAIIVFSPVISLLLSPLIDMFLMNSTDAVSGPAMVVEERRPSEQTIEQVRAWVQENCRAAGTVEFVEWSPLREVKDCGFSVRARYLAPTPSGGYDAATKVFFLDPEGNVSNVWTMT